MGLFTNCNGWVSREMYDARCANERAAIAEAEAAKKAHKSALDMVAERDKTIRFMQEQIEQYQAMFTDMARPENDMFLIRLRGSAGVYIVDYIMGNGSVMTVECSPDIMEAVRVDKAKADKLQSALAKAGIATERERDNG